jgi:hypothetical protein
MTLADFDAAGAAVLAWLLTYAIHSTILLAAAALAQWRDSLSAGEDLSPDLRRAAEALADSLAAFLAARP